MAEFMHHLRAGIERLQEEIVQQEMKIKQDARVFGTGPKSLGISKRAAKLLLRINTAYTKSKHVGGSELVFPILFGHMCYQTHRCWNVWTKTAVWRTLEAWRRSVGRIHAVDDKKMAEPERIVYADRGGLALLPKTWRILSDAKVMGPDGTIYSNMQTAQECFLASHAIETHISPDDIATTRQFFLTLIANRRSWR